MSRFEDFTTKELDMLTDACHFYYCYIEDDCDGELENAFWKLYQEGIAEWEKRSDRKDEELGESNGTEST